jgi:hypothetical protein
MATSSDPDDFESMFDPEFAIVRRGFDPGEVRRRLLQISGELRAARERELLLARQLEAAEARAEAAEARAEAVDPLDPAYLTKLLGDEVVRILDAARSAAAEIRQRAEDASVRLLEELRADVETEAETGTGTEAVSASGAETQTVSEPEPEPETMSAGELAPRSRRTGIDPARTNDLFASLRAQQDAPSPARPKRTATPKPTASPKRTATSKSTVLPKSATPSERTPSPKVVALTASLTRAVRHQLTDDFNSLLALVAVTGRRITPVPTELPDGAAPTTEQYIELVERLLDDQFPSDAPDREAVIEEAARCVAHDLVVPLRIRIDAVLAAAADPSALSGALRALFREWRDDRVGAAIGAVQASLPQMGEPRPD